LPCCGRDPNLLAVKLDGGTKEYFIWGLRVGFITYGAVCEDDTRQPCILPSKKKQPGAVRGSISNASHLSQRLMLSSMRDPGNAEEREAKFTILKARALKVKAVLGFSRYRDAWEAYPFNSGYFMCLKSMG
jgi:aspartate/methionine/tyrosine aminotransferase